MIQISHPFLALVFQLRNTYKAILMTLKFFDLMFTKYSIYILLFLPDNLLIMIGNHFYTYENDNKNEFER